MSSKIHLWKVQKDNRLKPLGASKLDLEETAELLRIPRSSVYKLAREGKIPAQKVGRHWRFHRETLEKWIAKEVHFDGERIEVEGLD